VQAVQSPVPVLEKQELDSEKPGGGQGGALERRGEKIRKASSDITTVDNFGKRFVCEKKKNNDNRRKSSGEA